MAGEEWSQHYVSKPASLPLVWKNEVNADRTQGVMELSANQPSGGGKVHELPDRRY